MEQRNQHREQDEAGVVPVRFPKSEGRRTTHRRFTNVCLTTTTTSSAAAVLSGAMMMIMFLTAVTVLLLPSTVQTGIIAHAFCPTATSDTSALRSSAVVFPMQRKRNGGAVSSLSLLVDSSGGGGGGVGVGVVGSNVTTIEQDTETTATARTTGLVSTAPGTVVPQRRQGQQQGLSRFGDVVDLRKDGGGGGGESIFVTAAPATTIPLNDDQEETGTTVASSSSFLSSFANDAVKKNLAVAVASISLAVLNYGWQFSHPITAVQLLQTMQSNSQPLSVIGTNGKPTVVDFWAPWCENCKLNARTLQQVEQDYGDSVNFCMVNGDLLEENGDSIMAFGVDAIPHLALVNERGNVETALIGPIPKHVLFADLDVLVENAAETKTWTRSGTTKTAAASETPPRKELPYTMLDVFAGQPEENRHVQF